MTDTRWFKRIQTYNNLEKCVQPGFLINGEVVLRSAGQAVDVLVGGSRPRRTDPRISDYKQELDSDKFAATSVHSSPGDTDQSPIHKMISPSFSRPLQRVTSTKLLQFNV